MNLKKLFAATLSTAMAASLIACGGSSQPAATTAAATTAAAAQTQAAAAPAATQAAAPAASGEKYHFIFAHGMSTETCFGPLGDAIEQGLEASGLFDVDVYAAGALGSESECIQSVQTGDIQAYCTAAASYSGYSNAFYVFDRMFAFTDADYAREVINDPDFLAAFNAEIEKVNFHVVRLNDLGFRQLFANKPVHSVADLQGMDFRTMENKVHMKGWADAGVNPTPISFSELYTSLQQGVVQGHENVLSSAYSSKIYEVQPYMLKTNHIFNVNALVINNEWYQALSPEAKEVFDKVMVDAREAMLSAEAALQEKYIETFEASGMEISECPDEMHEELVKRMAASYDICKELAGAELYDIFTATMEKYNK